MIKQTFYKIERNFAQSEVIDLLKTMLEQADKIIFEVSLETQFKEYIPEDKRYILNTLFERVRSDIEIINAELQNQKIEARHRK